MEYLKTLPERVKVVNTSITPAQTLHTDTLIQFRKPQEYVEEKYKLLGSALKKAGLNVPVIFNEGTHSPFSNNQQRYLFFKELRLDIPVDILRFTPGGSTVTISCIVYWQSERSESEMLTDGAQILQQMRSSFKEYHTRLQKSIFKNKVRDICKINSSLLEEVYKELAFDASKPSHPETGERIRAILPGETGL